MATGLYLKIGSGEQVHGESRDPHHVGWIELLSFSLGQGSPATSGSAPTRKGPLCHIEKVTDRTTTYLLNAARFAHPLDLGPVLN
jgi:type VI protein secretion system component Hcp